MSLRKQTINGMVFTGAQTFLCRMLNLITGIILARLIAPENFGVMAIIMVFQGVALVVIESGFGQALIQKKDLTQQDQNAVFYFNVAAGLLMFAVLYAAAPWIADFYEKEVLTSAIRFFAFSLPLISLSAVQATMLTRDLMFRNHVVVSVLSTVASSIVSIGLAFCGMDVWALVYGGVAGSAVQTLGFWLFGRWRPTFSFDLSALRGLFGFSSKMLLLTLIGQFTEQMYSLIIGKLYPIATLGFFQRAKNLRQMSVQTFSRPMNVVLFPSFSKLQHDHEKLTHVFLESLMIAMMVFVPLVLGLGAVSDDLIPLLYGDRWIPSVRLFKVLCWAVVLQPVTHFHSSLIKATGHPGLRLKAELIVSPLTLLMIWAAASYGLLALVATAVLRGWLWAGVMMYFSSKVIHVPVGRQLQIIGTFLLLGGGMYVFADNASRWLAVENRLLRLGVKALLGGLFYAAGIRLFCKNWLCLAMENVRMFLPAKAVDVMSKILWIKDSK